MRFTASLALAGLMGLSAATTASAIVTYELRPIGTYSPSPGVNVEGAAEIAAYDAVNKNLFVTNADTGKIDVISILDPKAPTKVGELSLAGDPNSVAVKNGVVAVAVADSADKTNPGLVEFFDATTFAATGSAVVGALPDMVTFTPDGTKVLVANEGESSETLGGANPDGSVSIVDVATKAVTTATLTGFNATLTPQQDLSSSVRVSPLATNFAQDAEPEYITVSADGAKAYVTLQEANAIAVVDVATATVTNVLPLGVKDYSKADSGFISYDGVTNSANKLDASDRDVDGSSSGGGKINIANWDQIKGMYMPDAVAIYEVNGRTYLVTANEGDGRGEIDDTDFPGYEDESRLRAATTSSEFGTIRDNVNAGRLGITTLQGDLDNDGALEVAYTLGGRSFSIWDVTDPASWTYDAVTGNMSGLVYDSGDDFEQIIAEMFPDNFNSTHEDANFDNRSDNKGPEPEGITIGSAFGRTFAFITLERIGGVMVYDITDPLSPRFVEYVNNRNFADNSGDLGPEGALFISETDGPNGLNLLVVTNEISGTTTVYSFIATPEPVTATMGLMSLAGLGLALRRRRA